MIFVTLIASAVHAVSYTYTGLGAEGEWADVNNWGGSGSPADSDTATVPDGFSPTFTNGVPGKLSYSRVDVGHPLCVCLMC